MITAAYSLTQVYGAELWLIFTLSCMLLYLAACGLIRRNRTKKGILPVLLGLLAYEAICDLVWAAAFYPGGEYHNYGLGGSYTRLLICPALLILMGVCVTWINAGRAN